MTTGTRSGDRRGVTRPAVARPLLVGLLFVLPLLASGPAVTAKGPADAPPAVELYATASESANDWLLEPLDAATLVDRSDRPEFALDVGTPYASGSPVASPVLSADGSTLASFDFDGREIVIRDGLAGPERTRFPTLAEVEALTISRDGTRLVATVAVDFSGELLGYPAWKVFDTADGRLLATIEGGEGGEQYRVDADLRRLYRLTIPGAGGDPTEASGPRPMRLVGHDLLTGAEVGRLELPGVRAGFWRTDREAFGGEPVMAELLPGFALSPDGGRLAIAHADEDAVTVVDAAGMTIERTVALGRQRGFLDRVRGLLSLVPETASAKAMEGTMLQAAFAADGRRLYLFGSVAHLEDDAPIFGGLGLRLVDVESGEVIADGLPDAQIERALPTPDGRAVYVAGWEPEAPAGPFVLRRLDAATLDVEAERVFPDYRSLFVRPAMVDGAAPLTVELLDHAFTPNELTVRAGVPVQLRFANHGTVGHNVTLRDDGGDLIAVDLAPGETETVTLHAAPGEYKLFCAVPGHAEAGMGGIVVVR